MWSCGQLAESDNSTCKESHVEAPRTLPPSQVGRTTTPAISDASHKRVQKHTVEAAVQPKPQERISERIVKRDQIADKSVPITSANIAETAHKLRSQRRSWSRSWRCGSIPALQNHGEIMYFVQNMPQERPSQKGNILVSSHHGVIVEGAQAIPPPASRGNRERCAVRTTGALLRGAAYGYPMRLHHEAVVKSCAVRTAGAWCGSRSRCHQRSVRSSERTRCARTWCLTRDSCRIRRSSRYCLPRRPCSCDPSTCCHLDTRPQQSLCHTKHQPLWKNTGQHLLSLARHQLLCSNTCHAPVYGHVASAPCKPAPVITCRQPSLCVQTTSKTRNSSGYWNAFIADGMPR